MDKDEASEEALLDARQKWDERYRWFNARQIEPNPDPWLRRWPSVLKAAGDGPVLDLGCGSGLDSEALTRQGIRAVSVDFAREALRATRQRLPAGRFVLADLRQGLPFAAESCQLIVANLVLHYYRWAATLEIVADIRRCLKPGGQLLARVNGVGDDNFGAKGNPQVEAGLFLVEGVLKRFFDRDGIESLFGRGWRLQAVQQQTTVRYQRQKRLWEFVAEKI